MKIKYKEHRSSKEFRTHSLSEIVSSKAYGYDDYIDNIDKKAQIAIEFGEKIVELLHSKGLIDDLDVKNLVVGYLMCDEEQVSIVKEK